MNNLLHKYIKITDATTNELVCSGRVVSSKDRYEYRNKLYKDIYFASVDNKHFFNVNNKTFNVEVLNDSIDMYVGKTRKYVSCKLTNFNKIAKKDKSSIDIVLDKDINGLDPPVKNLVYALNRLDYVETDGSCSGHCSNPLWVGCQFESLKPLILLAKVISTKFTNEFMLCTLKNRSQTASDKLGMCIVSYHKGTKAYKAANELAKYINLLSGYTENND